MDTNQVILGPPSPTRVIDSLNVLSTNADNLVNKRAELKFTGLEQIRCLYMNARSLVSKKDELLVLIDIYKPQIIGVTESWGTTDINDSEFCITGYNLFRKDRPTVNKGGGVLLYVSNELEAVEWNPQSQFPEQVWCKLKVRTGDELLVGVCYRSTNKEIFADTSEKQLIELIQELHGKHIMLMGDFNYPDIDWSTLQSHTSSGQTFLDSIEDCFLTQHVTEPTRGDSRLDLVFTNEPNMIDKVEVLGKLGNSDHNMLFWSAEVRASTLLNSKHIRDYNRGNYEAMRSELQATKWEEVLRGNTCEAWSTFKKRLQDLIDTYIPYKKIQVNKRRKALWITQKALRLVKKKCKAYSKYKNTRHPAYMKAARAAHEAVRAAKKKFESKLASNIKNDTKSFYAYVNSRSKARAKVGPLVAGSGQIISDSIDMAEQLNNYFTSVFTREDSTDMPTVINVTNSTSNAYIADITVTPAQVRKKLERLRSDKAAGPDNLSPRVLKEVMNEVCVPLTVILQRSLDEGSVPDDWRNANISPIYKKGGKALTANYRPVSLTSQISKLCESLVRDVLVEHLEKNNLIHDSQHGFRRGRSCLSNLLEFLDKVTAVVDEGNSVDVIYLDFAKAFDKVPHQRLLYKLQTHGIDGMLLRWIENWLSCRKQRVCVNGFQSTWQSVLSGVPQGSILGPVLFLIFINDLDNGISNWILKFADDTKVFGKVNRIDDIKGMQDDLDRLINWSQNWLMSFNVEKCKVIHLGRNNPQNNYYMSKTELENIDEEKDLGIIISKDLKWSKHCLHAYTKANKVLGMMNRTICSKDHRILTCLYKSLVRPHLEYCSPAWSPYYKKDKQMLEKVQHRFTRMIPGLKNLDYEERLRNLGLWSLEERRNRMDLLEVFKMKSGSSAVPFNTFFVIDTQQRTRGHTWKIVKQRNNLDVRKYFFSSRVVDRWNKLRQTDIDCESINGFKNKLDKLRKNKIGFFMD